jgi:hypothetical protein
MMLLDIIDLSSNEDHIATQPHAKLLDRPAVFVLANEGKMGSLHLSQLVKEVKRLPSLEMLPWLPHLPHLWKRCLLILLNHRSGLAPQHQRHLPVYFFISLTSIHQLCIYHANNPHQTCIVENSFKVNSDMLQARLLPLRRFCPPKLVIQIRMCLS